MCTARGINVSSVLYQGHFNQIVDFFKNIVFHKENKTNNITIINKTVQNKFSQNNRSSFMALGMVAMVTAVSEKNLGISRAIPNTLSLHFTPAS